MSKATPTGRDLDAALSLFDGYSWQERYGDMVLVSPAGITVGWMHEGGYVDHAWEPHCPRYSSSRDAMAEVEAEIGRRGLLGKYSMAICTAVKGYECGLRTMFGAADLFQIITAPAAVRAAAALAVLSEGR